MKGLAGAFPLIGASKSLRQHLAELGIEPIHKDEVALIKRNMVERTRAPGLEGYICVIRSNGYYSFMMAVAIMALSVAGAFSPLPAASGYPWIVSIMLLAAGATMAGWTGVWFATGKSGEMRMRVRDKGAHWRRSRIVYDETTRCHLFEGNNEFLYSVIPSKGAEILEKIKEIPGAQAHVEFCANDPFITVTRDFIFYREKCTVFHWD